MRLNKYLNEDISKFFIRLGSMSGQKQKHRGRLQAPAKKGIWLLPVQTKKYELSFLGGYNKPTNRLEVKEKDYEKIYGMSYDEYCELPYKEMEKLDNIVSNKQMKKMYKSIKLKNSDFVWTHMGKGSPDKEFEGQPWYKVTVSEYWKLFKKTFGKELKMGYSIDGQWAEIFWETT